MTFAGFGATTIELTVRKPTVAWRTGSTAVYVDDTGVAFSRNYYEPPSVKVVDQTGIVTEGNKVLASNRFLAFIGKLVGQMNYQQLPVEQVDLPPGTTRQVVVHVRGIGYPITFSIDRPVGEQAEDAARAVTYLRNRGEKPEYLDVRVSRKAFYK